MGTRAAVIEYGVLAEIVRNHRDRGDLPVPCVLALCSVGASFRPTFVKYRGEYGALVGDVDTLSVGERFGQQHAWGLMQVMGSVARAYRFEGAFTDLWDPETNLGIGMVHLRRLYRRHKNWPDAIADYHTGTVEKQQGRYRDHRFIARMFAMWSLYEMAERVRSGKRSAGRCKHGE